MKDERTRVAVFSLLWAIFVLGLKIMVGLLTGSIAVLSEAAHTGIDVVVTAVTLVAIRQSQKPPDERHPFGHGKVENLSALFETLILLSIAVMILVESIDRLLDPVFVGPVVAPWAFGVMIVALVGDLYRAHALHETAHKYNSQALEADALHFFADVMGTVGVLIGLGCTWFGMPKADPIAAMFVAGVIAITGIRLMIRAINDLLDRAPAGVAEGLKSTVMEVAGVAEIGSIRARSSGPTLHIEVTIGVDGSMTLQEAHDIATNVESSIKEARVGANVTVHVEPTDTTL